MLKRLTLLAVLSSFGMLASPSCDCGPPGAWEPDVGGRGADDGMTDGATADGSVEGVDGVDGADTDADPSGPLPGQLDERFRRDDPESCSDASDPPPRCESSPGSYDRWGPASVMTDLDVSTANVEECCFDLTGDGRTDNNFSALVGFLEEYYGERSVDADFERGFAEGEFTLVAEFEGLDDLESDDSYSVNFYDARAGSAETDFATAPCEVPGEDCDLETTVGESFFVGPTEFETGAFPRHRVPEGRLSSGELEAGPGAITVEFDFGPLGRATLPIRGATIEGEIDQSSSGLDGETGVTVERGKLGGYVSIRDGIDLLNQLMSRCDCIGRPERALLVSAPNREAGDPDLCAPETPEDACGVTCSREVRERIDQCGEGDGPLCRDLDTVCSVTSLIPGFTDVDADTDARSYRRSPYEGTDSISLGAVFEMVGARIGGVSAHLSVEGRSMPDAETVTIPQVYMAVDGREADGWVTVRADEGGSPDEILGFAALEPGWNREVGVDLAESVADGATLYAMLHEATGADGFNYDPSAADPEDPPLSDPKGERYVRRFEVTGE